MTEAAEAHRLDTSWQRDRETLSAAGYAIRVIRDRPGIVETHVADQALRAALRRGEIAVHRGRIRGAFPKVSPKS
jgi:hypothetical protein